MKLLIGLIVVVVVGGLGLLMWQAHENSPEVQAEKARVALAKKFDKAPDGHYVHLTPTDATLYKTSWSKEQLAQYVRTGNKDRTTFGTKQTFNREDSGNKNSKGITDQLSNTKTVYPQLDEQDGNYNPYFDSIDQARKDPNVKNNVTDINY